MGTGGAFPTNLDIAGVTAWGWELIAPVIGGPGPSSFSPRRLANGLDGVRIENKGRMSTLTFFNVSEKDYGNYTCVATNKLGNTNASIILYGRYEGLSLCFVRRRCRY